MTSRVVAGGSTINPDVRRGQEARLVVNTMYAGLALTVIAAILPVIDRATTNALTRHIRASYPNYSRARVNTAATVYLIYLAVIGIVGVATWLWNVRAVKRHHRWARAAATALFAIGTSVALTDLLVKDRSGQTALPPLLGWAGILPSLPGLLAVTLLWGWPKPPSRAVRTETITIKESQT